MKVLFSHDIFVAQTHGGASRVFVGLHQALLSLGVQSRIWGGLHVSSYLPKQGATGLRVGNEESLALRRAIRISNVAAERVLLAGWRPSVYHLTYFPRRTQAPALPVAVTVLDMIHELHAEQFPERDRTSERKRHWAKSADLVFAISHRTKEDLVDVFSVPEERVTVVYPGVPRLVPDATTDVRAHGDYLLYVGERGIPYKNFESFAVGMARSDIARGLNLVCFGGAPMTAEERELLEKLDLAGRTQRVQGSDGQLAALYAGACALVYPSKYEGFGFPPIEAMSLGCPVACSTGGSLPEVVGDAALLFDPDDVDEIASALDRIVADESVRMKLAAAGRDRARFFTWQRAGQDTLDAYRRLCGEPG